MNIASHKPRLGASLLLVLLLAGYVSATSDDAPASRAAHCAGCEADPSRRGG